MHWLPKFKYDLSGEDIQTFISNANLSLRTPIYIFLCLLEIVFPWKSYLDIKATYFLFFPPSLSDGLFLNQFPICPFSYPFTQLVANSSLFILTTLPTSASSFHGYLQPLTRGSHDRISRRPQCFLFAFSFPHLGSRCNLQPVCQACQYLTSLNIQPKDSFLQGAFWD